MAGAEETGKQRSQKMGQGEMGLGMLGRIQVIPKWENDPVCIHNGSIQESGQWQVRAPPQYRIRRRAEKCGAG